MLLYLIRGVPGSGKSELAKTLQINGIVKYIAEADDYFTRTGKYVFDASKLHLAHKQCQQIVDYALKQGFSVAVSNTSTTEKEVETYKQLAEKYNAKFVSIVVESRHDGTNQHNVPAEKIEQMKNRFSIKL